VWRPSIGSDQRPLGRLTDVIRIKGPISDLFNVTFFDESISREQTIVAKMTWGLEMLPIAASFLHRQLNQIASSQEVALQRTVHGNLKGIKGKKRQE